MDRTQAKLQGARFYTGFPCRRGHSGVRYTSTGNCVECLKMTEAPPIFVSKTFQGLPEDIRALEQAWVAIVEARRRRPTPALPPPNVSLPEPPVAPHVAPTLPAAPNPYGPPPMPTKR